MQRFVLNDFFLRCFSVGLVSGLLLGTSSVKAMEDFKVALPGPEIEKLLAGNTVVGRRSGHDHFMEYYRDDGFLQGEGYEGRWFLENNRLCILDGVSHQSVGDGEEDCYKLLVIDGQLSWLTEEGEVDGLGEILPGNAFSF